MGHCSRLVLPTEALTIRPRWTSVTLSDSAPPQSHFPVRVAMMAVRCMRTKKPWELLLSAAARLEREKKQAQGNLVRAFLKLETRDYMEAARYAEKAPGPIWLKFLREQFVHLQV